MNRRGPLAGLRVLEIRTRALSKPAATPRAKAARDALHVACARGRRQYTMACSGFRPAPAVRWKAWVMMLVVTLAKKRAP